MSYVVTFTGESLLTIPGTIHGLGTAALVYQLYDASVPARAIEPGSFHVDPTTYTVTIAFNVPQSGLLALIPALADIDTTPASPTANSYVSVDEATLLLQDHLHIEAWYTPDPENAVTLSHLREAALIQATRLLDAGVWWHGMPTTTTQALAWPQTGQVDHLGRPVAIDIIPRVIKQATAFYALALLDEGAAGGGSGGSGFDANIKTKKIGDTSITYKDEVVAPVSVAQKIPSEIRTMLRYYGIVTGSGIIPVLRT